MQFFGLTLRVQDIFDILIIAFIVYRLFLLLKGTRGFPMVVGVVFLLILAVVASFLNLHSVNWFVDQISGIWVLALLIIFAPEIRRALSRLGRSRLFRRFFGAREATIDEIVRTMNLFAHNKTGALLVFERDVPLGDYAERGVKLNSVVSSELLKAIFEGDSALHDGAVILENDIILAAAVMLPLTENPTVEKSLGARHRAALGISEVSDAIVIVVSEETGQFSLVRAGEILVFDDASLFKSYLQQYLRGTA